MDPRKIVLTPFQKHALTVLRDRGPLEPYQLYELLFPTGTFTKRKDTGSSKGGPSRTECAVNFHLGKLGPLVHRSGYFAGDGRWHITVDGLAALRMDAVK